MTDTTTVTDVELDALADDIAGIAVRLRRTRDTLARGTTKQLALRLTPAEANIILNALADTERRAAQPTERLRNLRHRVRDLLADYVQEVRV